MGTVFTLLGWVLALALAEATVSSVVRIARHAMETRHFWNAPGWPLMPPLLGCAAAVMFTVLGVLPVLSGAVLAGLPAVVVAVLLVHPWAKAVKAGHGAEIGWSIVRGVAGHVRGGLRYPFQDIRSLLALRHGPEPRRHEDPAPPRTPPPGTPPEPAAAIRSVPAVRDDPNLGGPLAPADAAAVLEGVIVPPWWVAVAEQTGEFDAEDQQDLHEHMDGEAAGLLAFAEAAEARAETLLSGRKLHPAYVAALLEVADAIAEAAATAAMAGRRYHAVYGDIEDWHDEGNELPEDARNWGFGGAA